MKILCGPVCCYALHEVQTFKLNTGITSRRITVDYFLNYLNEDVLSTTCALNSLDNSRFPDNSHELTMIIHVLQ